jgi:uncharacterized protein involved in exopolysaccharide biosynthesis
VIGYFEAYFRHRYVLLLPVVLAVAVALGYAVTQPNQYQATASVWFQPSSTAADGTTIDPDTSSSKAGLAVMTELLASRAFVQRVGYASPLKDYLRGNPDADAQGVSAFINRALRGVHVRSAAAPLSGQALDDRLEQTVRAGVTAVATGPQILTVTVYGPTPEVSTGVAGALIAQFFKEVIADRTTLARARADFLKVGMDQAAQQVKTADSDLADYSATKVSPGDLTLTRLAQTSGAAHQTYHDAAAKYNQAASVLSHIADNPGFNIVDQPVAASTAVSTTKRTVYAALAGLVVGLTMMLTLVMYLVTTDRTARRPRDLEAVLGIPVAASVGIVSRPRTAWRPVAAPPQPAPVMPATTGVSGARVRAK